MRKNQSNAVEFKKLQKGMKEFQNQLAGPFAEACLQEAAQAIIRHAVQETPIGVNKKKSRGKRMYQRWTAGEKEGNSPAAVTKTGDIYHAKVRNTAPYASFVEYGHRTKSGRLVPGRNILSGAAVKAQTEINEIVNEKMKQLLEECLHGS